MLYRLLLALTLIVTSAPAALANDDPRSSQPSYAACADEYREQAAPYWSVLKNILTMEALFHSYVNICRKVDPSQFAAVRPYVDQLQKTVKQDADASYDVMALLMAEKLPSNVSKTCRNNRDAQAAALGAIHRTMDITRQKTANRINRTARDVGSSDVEICHNLVSMKKDFIDTRLGGQMPDYPLFQAASMQHFQQKKLLSRDSITYLSYGQARRKVALSAGKR